MAASKSCFGIGGGGGEGQGCVFFGNNSDNNNNNKKNDEITRSATTDWQEQWKKEDGDHRLLATMNMDEQEVMARELNKLTVDEREKIYDEIHGVAEIAEETEEFVTSCIEQLEQTIRDAPTRRRAAYEKAVFLRPSIDKDVQFKLMFLRADYYDPVKAAHRLLKYFDDKITLFGESKVAKDITLDDLSEEDLELFRSGMFVILPYTDRAGRPICFADVTKLDFSRGDSMDRCCWYSIMATLEDENAQLKGVSVIQYCIGQLKLNVPISKFLDQMKKGGDVITNLPMRVTSYHFCYNNVGVKFMLAAFQKTFGSTLKLRLRTHFGSPVEVQYSLMTYGIICPLILNKNCDNEMIELLDRHIERRLVKEREETRRLESPDESDRIACPKAFDILVGRGYPYQNYTGNQRLVEIVQTKFLERHNRALDRFEKTCIYLEVITTINESFGSRFLERSPQGWKLVSDNVARKKVCSAFRSTTAKLTTLEKKANSNNDTSVENPSKRIRCDKSLINNNSDIEER